MRSLLLSALAATAVIAAASVGLTTDASAATRHLHQHRRAHVVPDVRQDPSGVFNQFNAPSLPDPALTYRWVARPERSDNLSLIGKNFC